MDFEYSEVNPCTIERIPDTKGRMSWFMAIMVAMFHSQHSREILSKSMNNWNLELKLFKLLKNFFNQIYEKGYSDSDETILKLLYETNPEMFMIDPSFGIYGVDPIIYIGELYDLLNIDYVMFEFNEFITNSLVFSLFNKEYNKHVLKHYDKEKKRLSLKINDNSKFMSRFNRKYGKMRPLNDDEHYSTLKKSNDPWKTIKRTGMRMLGVYEERQKAKKERYDNELNARRKYTEQEIYEEDNLTEDKPEFSGAPPILIVRVLGIIPTPDGLKYEKTYKTDDFFISNSVNDHNISESDHKIRENITSMKNKINYMGEDYVLDSVILYNPHNYGGQHIAVGITCNNKKYIYNALDIMDENKIFYTRSARLVREDWDINKQSLASWDNMGTTSHSRATKLLKILPINEENEEMYFEFNGNQFSYNFREGNRTLIYVKKNVKKNNNLVVGGLNLKKNLLKPKKSAKKCPEGKVLNPKTGRYILIKNKSLKKCPKGKVLNPKTGRYINKKPLIVIKPYNKKGGRICSQILTPKQVGETCWFMAIFVAMFYSQRSRKILLGASKDWDIDKDLFKKLNDILRDKYLKTSKGNDYNDYNGDIFIEILSLLYKENKIVFPYNPKKFSYGFWAEVYIGRLYKLLNVEYKMFDYQPNHDRVAYSAFNEDLDIFRYDIFNKNLKRRVGVAVKKGYKYVEDKKAPPILIIRLYDDDRFNLYSKGNMLDSHVLPKGEAKDELKSTREKITYNEKIYKLDSTILMSFNGNDYGESHYITGITCKNKKYLYNGWLRTQMDPKTVDENKIIKIPCELMRYEWEVDNKYFCIDTSNCSPKILDYHTELKKTMSNDFCFNFKYGQRLLIYVREDAKSQTSKESSSSPGK